MGSFVRITIPPHYWRSRLMNVHEIGNLARMYGEIIRIAVDSNPETIYNGLTSSLIPLSYLHYGFH
jgi:hypothetical protein